MTINKQLLITLTLGFSSLFGGSASQFTSNTQGYGLSIDISSYANPHLYYATVQEYSGEASALKFPLGDNGIGLNLRMSNMSYGIVMISIQDIESRSSVPTAEPLSHQNYSMVMPYISYQKAIFGGTIYTSLNTEMERTVNYNTALLGFAGAYGKTFSNIDIALGVRDINLKIKTTTNYVSAPLIAYSTISWHSNNIFVLSEINTSDFPIKAGINYKLASLLQVQTGLKYEANSKAIYGSFGLFANVENFKFGFAVSNLLHDLGPTTHYNIAWKFR